MRSAKQSMRLRAGACSIRAIGSRHAISIPECSCGCSGGEPGSDDLPDDRIVLRFEFSGVAASKTKLRLMWLVLDRPEIDVCMKDPGHPVDVLIRGDIATFVAIFLGHARWKDKVGKSVMLEGDRGYAAQMPKWFGV